MDSPLSIATSVNSEVIVGNTEPVPPPPPFSFSHSTSSSNTLTLVFKVFT